MKLSEAIRAGAKMRPQSFGRMFGFTEGDAYGSCALGGAFESLCGVPHFDEHKMTGFLTQRFPILDARAEIPTHPGVPCSLRLGIMMLNDNSKWSREAIAEWVETVENSLEKAAQKPEVSHPTPAQTVDRATPVLS